MPKKKNTVPKRVKVRNGFAVKEYIVYDNHALYDMDTGQRIGCIVHCSNQNRCCACECFLVEDESWSIVSKCLYPPSTRSTKAAIKERDRSGYIGWRVEGTIYFTPEKGGATS